MVEAMNQPAATSLLTGEASYYRPSTIADATSALRERGTRGQAIAGATWVMRSGLRGEPQGRDYVSLSAIDEMRRIVVIDEALEIGACVTHTELALALANDPRCMSLAAAAAHSANPAVRNVATVGGNLCASDFPAADLVPALMSLNAMVDLESMAGSQRVAIEEFMKLRTTLEPGLLVSRIVVPLRSAEASVSAHVRLPLRKAGDYPVAIVSIALRMTADRKVASARVVVGSVEPCARRWHRLEDDLIGSALDTANSVRLAESHVHEFIGRDGVEAPGWYRVKVLPTLVFRAIEQISGR